MPGKKRITPEQIAEIRRLLDSGKTLVATATAVGVSRSSVLRILGEPTGRSRGGARAVDPTKIAEGRRLLMENPRLSYAQVAKIVGVSQPSLYRAVPPESIQARERMKRAGAPRKDTDVEKMRQRALEGASLNAIARELGFDIVTVARRLMPFGLPKNPKAELEIAMLNQAGIAIDAIRRNLPPATGMPDEIRDPVEIFMREDVARIREIVGDDFFAFVFDHEGRLDAMRELVAARKRGGGKR